MVALPARPHHTAQTDEGWDVDVGNGFRFRTRSEADARLFLKELELRAGKRPPRRQQRIALGIVCVVLLTWFLWSFLIA